MPERLPIHRRPWFFKTVVILVNFAVLALIGAYIAHRHFTVEAGKKDLEDLGRMESASTIYDRWNQTFGHIYLQNRDPVTMADIPENMIKAVIASEDARFYEHGGIDFRGIARAFWRNLLAGRSVQGASTITQQLARNTYGLYDKTLYRKFLEAYVSWRIEANIPKQKILELYLNRIYLGGGHYGVESASRGYFGKPAKQMTLAECATLVGLIPSPNKRNPWRNEANAQKFRGNVLARMVETGAITPQQSEAAQQEKLVIKQRTFATADSYAMEAVRQQVISKVGFERATSQGLRVFTTLDTQVQRTAEASMKKKMEEIESRPDYLTRADGTRRQTHAQYSELFRDAERRAQAVQKEKGTPVPPSTLISPPEYIQGSLIAVDNADGGVIALIGGREFKHSEFNRANSSKRQFGTAFTPLVYAAAYEKGIGPNTLVQDALMDNRLVMIGGVSGILGEWGVERVDNRYDGLMPASFALVRAKNGATVRFGNEVGLENVLAFAKKAGIKSELRAYPATFLGQSEITLAEMATAYTIFPNAGWRPANTYIVKQIQDREGKILYQAKSPGRTRVTDENSAFQVHNGLSESLKWGPAADASRKYGLKPFPAGAKTGTAYNSTDVCAIGYTSSITCAVWAGFDKPQPIYRGAFGSDLMLPVWSDVMNAAYTTMKAVEFPKPPGLKRVEICYYSGQKATDKCSEVSDTAGSPRRRTTYFEYLTPKQEPKQECPYHLGGVRPLATQRTPRDRPQEGAVVAVRAIDLDSIPVVPIGSPAVLDNDPYRSIRPPNDVPAITVVQAGNSSGPLKPGQSTTTEVRRAKSAGPLDADVGLPKTGVEPPPVIKFN